MQRITKMCFIVLIFVKVLLLLTFSVILFPLLFANYILLIQDTVKVFAFGVSVFIVAIDLFFSVYGLALSVRFLLSSQRSLLKKDTIMKVDEKLQYHIEKLANKVGISAPTLRSAKGIKGAFSFGLDNEKASIFVSPWILENLDHDELTAVFLHEMYHIKEDVEMQSFRIVFKKIFDTPITTIFLELLLLASVVLIVVGVGPNVLVMEYALLETMKVVIWGLLVFALVSLALVITWMWQMGGDLAGQYLYIRELLADSYSAITSHKPSSMASAIIKTLEGEEHSTSKGSHHLSKLNFIQTSERKGEIPDTITLVDMFYTQLRSTFNVFHLRTPKDEIFCPFEFRFSLLKKLQRLITDKVKIVKLKPSYGSISSINLTKMPRAAVKLLRGNKLNLTEFFNYIEKRGDWFNLIECARFLNVDPFDVFLMLVAAANSRFINL